jgi:signal transduction histidine kinase
VVKGIVDGHGGTVRVLSSTPGKGTTMVVELPAMG